MRGDRQPQPPATAKTAGDIAADEWRAGRSPDEENAEREMRQFVWCIPVSPAKWDETALDGYQLASRVLAVPRGIVPEDASKLTMGIDLGKYLCHWALVAWSDGARGHVVDYGRVEVPSREFGVEQALLHSLRELRDEVQGGWPRRDAGKRSRQTR